MSSPTPGSLPPSEPSMNIASNHKVTIGNFQLGETIGVGSFGKVKIAEHVVTGHKVAVKIINRSKIKSLRMDLKIRREIANMKLFRHPHIIRLYEVIETPEDIFMVMEYVPGGELFDFIVSHGKLSEDEARMYFQQIISGVEYCHKHMVVHRDLKPENLLLDEKKQSVKIADFGLSTMMQDGEFLKTSCGSPNYASPEVISGKLYAGPEVDVWSCGVILYTLLCARLPFDDEYIPALFKKIRSGIFDIPSHVTNSCKDLLRSMLEVDQMKRITVPEIRRHPWFQVNLPSYLVNSPEISILGENIDEEIVKEIEEKYSVDRQTILDALHEGEKSNRVNEFIVAYHLIYDSKKIYSVEPVVSTLKDSSIPSLSMMDLRSEDLISPDSPIIHGEKKIKMWNLGIISTKSPNKIMEEIYRALRVIGFVWKSPAAFQLRCKYQTEDKDIKIALQLYKVNEGKHLLDIKKISEETFPFFDICSKLLKEMKI